jgi:glycosyltransferase involved in cell wall biosynthesis
VLLVPDKFHWILGQIAKAIVEANPGFDFAYATRDEIRRCPTEIERLGQRMSLVHWILDLEFYSSLPSGLGKHPAQVASVHHVLDWNRAKGCLGASRIHVVSTEWRDYLLERGAEPGRIAVVPNGVDVARFNAGVPKLRARREFGLPEAGFVVGFFGSAHPPSRPRKGVDVFVEAMSSLAARMDDLVVLVCGQAWEADLETFRKAGVRVSHQGFVSSRRMPAAYRALDVFVVASTVEGGPMTAFEALASEIPVVTTSVGMVRDWLQDGVHVDVVPAGQAEALASAIRAVHDEPGRAQGLAVAGAQLVRNRLKWSDVACGYGAVYREALEDAKRVSVPVYSRGWFRRQRNAVLRSDLADLVEREAAAGHLARAAGILVEDGSGFSGRLAAAFRLLGRAGSRFARTARHAASELGRRA